jgi:hypothetical protein
MSRIVEAGFISRRLQSMSGRVLLSAGVLVLLIGIEIAERAIALVVDSRIGSLTLYLLAIFAGIFVFLTLLRAVLRLEEGWKRLSFVASGPGIAGVIVFYPFGSIGLNDLHALIIVGMSGTGFGFICILCITWVIGGFNGQSEPEHGPDDGEGKRKRLDLG